MNASDADRAASDVRPSVPERNGDSSLSDRVRSLSLANRPGSAATRTSVLPWLLCGLLLLTTAAFGYRTYRLSPSGEPSGTTDQAPAAAGSSTGAPTSGATAVAASGDVVLESKGYAIPAHQIQVSPNKVSGMLVYVHPRLDEGNRFQQGE